MNGKKARAARRAERLSGEATRSRLRSKAARVDKTAAENAFNAELGSARRVRTDALTQANVAYVAACNVAEQERTRERKRIEEAYSETRDLLVKKYAAVEAADAEAA